MIILLHWTSKKLGGWKSVFVKQPNNQSRIKIKHAIHSRNLQAKRSRKCLPSPQETLTDTHTHTLGHMMTSSQHEYSRAVHSYSATVRLSTARALLRSAARSSPTRIPHPSPTLSPLVLHWWAHSEHLTSSIESPCFTSGARKNLPLIPFRSLPT